MMGEEKKIFLLCVYLVYSILLLDNVVSYGILKSSNSTASQLFCVGYNDDHQKLPKTLEEAEKLTLKFYNDEELCNNTGSVPSATQPATVAVNRGNCTFNAKAVVAEELNYTALLIINAEEDDLLQPFVNGTNLTVALISNKDFNDVQDMGDQVKLQFYSPAFRSMDYNIIVIFVLAVGSVAVGAAWGGRSRYNVYLKKLEKQKRRRRREVESEENSQSEPGAEVSEPINAAENGEMTVSIVIIFIMVIFMCTLIVLLYFFYDKLVYVVIVLFLLGGIQSLFESLMVILHRIPGYKQFRIPENQLPVLKARPPVFDIPLLLGCITFGVVWLVYRNSSFGWIFQDILGVAFCINAMKSVRLPNLQVCALFMSLLFLYDIFFVFLTPLFMKDGKSILVDVATGGRGQSKEQIPLVIKVPYFASSDYDVCGTLGYSLLGFGDILLPGLLVSYLAAFDYRVQSKKAYYISSLLAYTVGLIITFVALILMRVGQPALLYLVPCTLLTTIFVALCRGELRHLWKGTVPVLPANKILSDEEEQKMLHDEEPVQDDKDGVAGADNPEYSPTSKLNHNDHSESNPIV